MRNQLWQVVRTYLTRPLVWVLGGIALLIVLIPEFYVGSDHHFIERAPAVKNKGVVVNSLRDLDKLEGEGGVGETETFYANLVAIYLKPQESTPNTPSRLSPDERQTYLLESLAITERMPKLKVLHVDYTGLDTMQPAKAGQVLRRIGQLKQLEQLSIRGAFPNPDLLRYLGGLKKLKILDLSEHTCKNQTQVNGGFHHLSELPKLKTLVVGRDLTLDDKAVEDISSISSLATLVLAPVYAGEPSDSNAEPYISDAGLVFLAKMPHLKNIYIEDRFREKSAERTAYANRLRRRFVAAPPGVGVHRRYYNFTRTFALLRLIIANLFILGVLVLQMGEQLSRPPGNLTPRLMRSHLVVSGGVAVSLLMANVCFMVWYGSQLGAGIMLCTFVIGTMAACLLLPFSWTHRRNASRNRLDLLGYLASTTFLVPMALFYSWNAFGSAYIESLLLGDAPKVLIFLFVYGSLSTLWCVKAITRLPKFSIVQGYEFSTAQIGVPNRARRLTEQQKTLANISLPFRLLGQSTDRSMSTFLSRTHDMSRTTERLAVWRAANASNVISRTIFTGLVAIVFTTPSFLVGQHRTMATVSYLVMLSMNFVLINPILVMSLWRDRMRVIPTESIRPVTGRNFRRDIAGAISIDILLPWLLVGPVIVVAALYAIWSEAMAATALIPLLAMYTGGGLIAFASTFLAITVGRNPVLRTWFGRFFW